MSYQNYGIPRELVERIKLKMKHRPTKERVKALLEGVTREDLQSRPKVKALLDRVAKALNEPLSEAMSKQVVQMVLDLKIDPNNTFHLIKLWGMFR